MCCIDYQNMRSDYVAAFVDHLVDWKFVENRLLRSSDKKKIGRA